MNIKVLFGVLIFLFYQQQSYAQDGTLDLSFGRNGIVYHQDANNAASNHPWIVRHLLLMPDSTMVFYGQPTGIFLNPSTGSEYGGFAIGRLNKDGKFMDTSWQRTPSPYFYRGYYFIQHPLLNVMSGDAGLQLLASGKILMTGRIFRSNGSTTQITTRLNYPSLSVDTTYGINGIGEYVEGISDLPEETAIAPDGNTYTVSNEIRRDSFFTYIIKRKQNGLIDSSWQNKGLFIYAPEYGALASDIKIASNGDIYTCGVYKNAQKLWSAFILKQRPDGTIDRNYGLNGRAIEEYKGNKIWLNTDGSTYLIGDPFQGNSYISKFKANGLIDINFGINGRTNIPGIDTGINFNSIIVQPNGRLVLGGTAAKMYSLPGGGVDYFSVPTVWRLLSNGKIDTTFAHTGGRKYEIMPDFPLTGVVRPNLQRGVESMLLQPDGKILLGGYFNMTDQRVGEMFVLRINNRYNLPSTGVGTALSRNTLKLSAAPVPADDILHIGYSLSLNDEITMSLTDVTGRTVSTKQLGMQSIGSYNIDLPLYQLPGGIYILTISGKANIGQLKVEIR